MVFVTRPGGGTWTVCRFKRGGEGLGKKEGMIDTPMHSM